MTPFLKRLAKEIATRYANDPGQLCVVLPNRRAGLYLKKYLAEELRVTTWAPQTYSMEDFITGISGRNIIDPTGLLFEFYHVHKTIQGDKAQEFEVFADWAHTLLQDFDELDQYLIDPTQIFTFLNAARALTVWNLDGKPLTEQEENYINFYNSLLGYYTLLSQRLQEKNLVYRGLAYRWVAENIAAISASFNWKRVFFAGLNALSNAEESIVDYLLHNDLAEVFWDADEYYINDVNQEAGRFIRKYHAKWPSDPVRWLETNFRDIEKKIRVFGVPGSMGQALKAGKLVQHLSKADERPDKTAVVLADETLLLPVLYSLPENFGPVNVTMGYPFKYTHLYQLAGMLFQMQENAEKFAVQRKKTDKSFYVKDVLNLLSHPYLNLFEPAAEAGQLSPLGISETLQRKNRVFLRTEEITRYSSGSENELKQIIDILFTVWESPSHGLTCVVEALGLIRDHIIASGQKSIDRQIDLEYLFHLSKQIKRCRTLMESYSFIRNLKTLRKILFQLLDASRLPFSGEPLQGIQVMGVLETRAVDFENLVVLSVNEGILPSGRLPNSFIPFDIKSEFGLPTYQHKDAVFAYHFYRMIQRAKNIYLLYDTEGDKMKGGEKSRFIMQLDYELQKFNPKSLIEEKPPDSGSAVINKTKAIVKEKTSEVMQRLLEKSSRGFSPSSLNLFIKCPLHFYFQEVLGLPEAETVEETIEARTMGTAVHEVLYKVYTPFTGKHVDPATLAASLANTENFLVQAFKEHYKEGDLDFGKNHLIFKVSHFLINELIKQEAKKITESDNPANALKIVSLETSFESIISCRHGGGTLQVKIRGKADRIDRYGDQLRIIDYKTGLVQASELRVKSWEALITEPKNAKAFQLLVYAWLFFRNEGMPDLSLKTGNITLRKISEGFIGVRLPDDQEIQDQSMQLFEEILKELVENILDAEVPFRQTEDIENCTYCPFKAVCTR